MHRRKARVLVVDTPDQRLSRVLVPTLARYEVEIARDVFDALDRIEGASRVHDVIFCDLACEDLPGPELWAYLATMQGDAADRMVFVASTPLAPDGIAFLHRVTNQCMDLPLDPGAVEALALDAAGFVAPSCRSVRPPSTRRAVDPAPAEGRR